MNFQQITSELSAFKDRDFRLSRLGLVGINLRADGESFETETWNKVPRFPHILLTAKSARDYRNFKTFTFYKKNHTKHVFHSGHYQKGGLRRQFDPNMEEWGRLTKT